MRSCYHLLGCMALAAMAAASHGAAPYTESNVTFTLTTANAWAVRNVTDLGVPAYAVCEISIENGDTGNEVYGGVRAVGSRFDRRLLLREAEGGGKVAAVMHVQVNRDGAIECYAGSTANITFRILGYWTAGSYVERFNSFDSSSNNAWVDTNLSSYGVPGGRLVELLAADTNSYGQGAAGGRAKGSALGRSLSLGDARDGGLHGFTLWVQANGSGVVQTYNNQANTQLYLLGYWEEAPLPYVEAWSLLPDPSPASTWQAVALPSGPAGGSIAEVVMTQTNTSTRIVGLQRVGSTANRQVSVSKSFNSGAHVGLRMHAVADGEARVEAYSSSPVLTFHRLAGYWIQPSVDNGNGATAVSASGATLNGTLATTGTYDTAVEVWYGTADGGTDPLSWGTGYSFGPGQTPGSFAYPAGSLTADTLYFYRFAASNQTGRTWAGVADGRGPATFLTGNVWVGDVTDASEQGLVPGTVMVHRVAGATAGPLTVNLTIAGSAEENRHVAPVPHQVVIPAGASAAPLVVTPVPEWFTQTGTFITAAIAAGPYLIDPLTNSATVFIHSFGAPSTGGTNTWISDGSVSSSTDGRNWSTGHAPLSDEHVLLGGYSLNGGVSDVPLNWSGHVQNVASWTQTADYTGTVTIPTVFPGQGSFTSFSITGDLVLAGGTWTQVQNPDGATAVCRLSVSVGRDFTLGAAARIYLDALGFTQGDGPGTPTRDKPGATHGGRGDLAQVTYGSILSPSLPGSGSRKPSIDGGGSLWLEVAGSSSISGTITANGSDSSNNQGAASGGSVYLRTGTLTGTGSLRVNGGQDYWHGDGGGGRLAVILAAPGATFTGFTGTMQAFGGPHGGAGDYQGIGGGAGTVYQQSAGEAGGAGKVTVDNNNYSVTPTTYPEIACTLPSGQLNGGEDLSRTRWELQRRGHVNLVADCRIADLTITGSTPILHLYGKTLTVNSLSINGTKYGPGVHLAADLPQVEDLTGGGRIIVHTGGTMVLIR